MMSGKEFPQRLPATNDANGDAGSPKQPLGELSAGEVGCFAIEPIPETSFRLRYRAPDGADVLTGWIVL